MLVFADLDKTLVYSGQPEHSCVEYKDGQEITFMTNVAKQLLFELLNKEEVVFIPCTLRSKEQVSRIEFITDDLVPFLICDNGFSIYYKGVLDEKWDQQMQASLAMYPNMDLYRILCQYIEKNNIPICQVKSNRDAFFTVIFHQVEDVHIYADDIIAQIDTTQYKIEIQGRKLYIIPNFLDKVLALGYLKNIFPHDMVVTTGDSNVDLEFLMEGDVKIVPNHSNIIAPNIIRTTSNGIVAGEEILNIVIGLVSKI